MIEQLISRVFYARNVAHFEHWRATGIDVDGDSGTFSGATPFLLSEVNPDTFIPYEELTEAEVLGWIQAVVVGSYKEHVDGQINKQIALIKDPVVEVPSNELPWVPPVEEVVTTEAPVA
jgi:hypothetical protein